MEKDEQKGKIVISKDGPYLVSGDLPLQKEIIIPDEEGFSCEWKKGEKYPQKKEYRLCRCGRSANKPYCDGSHLDGFDGTEVASKQKYAERIEEIVGPDLILKDVEALCSSARFCDRKGGTWDLTRKSDDPEAKKTAIEQCHNCPSGRLVACDKETGIDSEPELEKAIGIVEDPASGVSGPIWVKGGVEIESEDGFKHEKRNRVTLCRCGKSANKPYCDGTHIGVKFNDGDETISKAKV